MIKEFIKLINAYAHGQPGEFKFTFSWWDVFFILVIAGLLIYIVWK